MLKRFAIILTLCSIYIMAMGQSVNTGYHFPFVCNYSPADYNSSNTNWSVVQNSDGRIYAANNSGLLVFNGEVWEKLYPFGENQSVRIRALLADGERIYLGAYREFGYIDYDTFGNIHYHSLSGEISDQIGKEDEIWHIHKLGSKVFFLYFNCCYVHDVSSNQTIRINVSSSVCYDFDNKLYLSSQSGQLHIWEEEKNSFAASYSTPDESFILKMFSREGRAFAVTSESGLISIDSDGKSHRIDKLGKDYPIVNRCLICKDTTIILGTIGNGVIALDRNGNILWKIDKDSGLQNNDVMSLAEDNDGNIWVALDKGISIIYKDGPSFIPIPDGSVGKVTAILKTKDNRILVGSNNGLYKMTLDNGPEYKAIGGIRNQVWSISEIDGDILIGGNTGTMLLDKANGLKRISDVGGGTKVLRRQNGDLIQGSFAPIKSLEKRSDGKWTSENYITDFYIPAGDIEEDHLSNLWIQHMYEGLYRVNTISRKDSVTCYPSLESGTRSEKVHISRLGGRLLFSNASRFYVYDDLRESIVPYNTLNDKLKGYAGIKMVSNSSDGKLWIAFDDGRVSRIDNEDEGLLVTDVVDVGSLGIRMLEDNPDIVSLDGSSYLIPVEGGFLALNSSNTYLKNRYGHIGIESIIATEGGKRSKDRQQSCRQEIDGKKLSLKNGASIEIHLYKSFCKYNNSARISYILKGYDAADAPLNEGMTASYNNLPRGNYEFYATLQDSFGDALDSVTINISVSPSFWGSWMGILLYLGLSSLLAYGAYTYIRHLLKRQKKRMEDIMEKEMIDLKNKQLEESLLLKSDDLAKYSLIEAQRNKVLDQIRDKINSMLAKDTLEMKRSDYRELMRIIEDGGMSSDAWGTFYNNFDLVHDSFFKNLSRRYPSLTQSDLRYCAYIRLNMSTKEIAKATGVTIKGVEAAKGRLRKKMGIPQDISICTFLLKENTP